MKMTLIIEMFQCVKSNEKRFWSFLFSRSNGQPAAPSIAVYASVILLLQLPVNWESLN